MAVDNRIHSHIVLLMHPHFTQTPVLLRFRGYDRLFGSHYDEYVIEYSGFSAAINQSVFSYATSELFIGTENVCYRTYVQ